MITIPQMNIANEIGDMITFSFLLLENKFPMVFNPRYAVKNIISALTNCLLMSMFTISDFIAKIDAAHANVTDAIALRVLTFFGNSLGYLPPIIMSPCFNPKANAI